MPSDIQSIPYPADTFFKGWRFELDTQRITASDTWALAPAETKPWLLMLWMTAWQQKPIASFPNNDRLIAARLGMPLDQFLNTKEFLMRGWWLAEDGRLYHNTMVEVVYEMLECRNKEKERKAEYRLRTKLAEELASTIKVGQPISSITDEILVKLPIEMSHVRPTGQPRDSHRTDGTRTRTGTSTRTKYMKTSAAATALPPYLDPEVWEGYCKFRKAKSGKGWTQHAHDLNLISLAKLYNDGHDVNACINASIMKGYAAIFPLSRNSQELVNIGGVQLSRAGAITAQSARQFLEEIHD